MSGFKLGTFRVMWRANCATTTMPNVKFNHNITMQGQMIRQPDVGFQVELQDFRCPNLNDARGEDKQYLMIKFLQARVLAPHWGVKKNHII